MYNLGYPVNPQVSKVQSIRPKQTDWILLEVVPILKRKLSRDLCPLYNWEYLFFNAYSASENESRNIVLLILWMKKYKLK